MKGFRNLYHMVIVGKKETVYLKVMGPLCMSWQVYHIEM